jgi:hypothetical protein
MNQNTNGTAYSYFKGHQFDKKSRKNVSKLKVYRRKCFYTLLSDLRCKGKEEVLIYFAAGA